MVQKTGPMLWKEMTIVRLLAPFLFYTNNQLSELRILIEI